MKKVLILGSNGFVGAHLAQYLSKNHYVIRAAYSPNSKKSDSVFFRINSNEILSTQLQYIYNQFNFEVIIYAWSAVNSSESAMKEIYVDRLKEVISFANSEEISLIFFSAGSALRDHSQFAQYNLRAEEIITSSQLEKWIILRPTLIFGPNDNKNLTPIFKMVRFFPIILLPKNGQVIMRPIYIHDLSRIIALIIDSSLYSKEILLISGEESIDLRDYIGLFLKEIKKKPIIINIDLMFFKNILKKIHQRFKWLPLEQLSYSSSTYQWPHTDAIQDRRLSFTLANDALREWVKDEFSCH